MGRSMLALNRATVRKTPVWSHFDTKNDQITKTGSGQTWKTLREDAMARKRTGKTPRGTKTLLSGQADPGWRARMNVEEGRIGDTSIVEEDEFKTDEASSMRSS